MASYSGVEKRNTEGAEMWKHHSIGLLGCCA